MCDHRPRGVSYASTRYEANAQPAATATDLTGPASITVLDSENVVDSVPAAVASCPSS